MWSLVVIAAMVIADHAAEDVPAKKNCTCIPYYMCRNSARENSELCSNSLEICCGDQPVTTTESEPVLVEHTSGCGIRNPKGIGPDIIEVGKGKAQFGEFPWMVGILRLEQLEDLEPLKVYQCGGSLIHPQVVLTGAHCVHKNKAAQLKVRAGEWDTHTKTEMYSHQDRDVESIVYHEKFKENNLHNDVALLFLTKSVSPAENIGFSCLPPQDHVNAPGTRCFATGWGKDISGKDGKYQPILKKMELPVVENQQCQDLLRKTRLGSFFRLHNSFMCAGGEKVNSTCKGDGGSPLVCPVKDVPNQYMQSGIVSWGIGCGDNESPAVFTNVAIFRNWIDAKMAEAQLEAFDYSYLTKDDIFRR